jgi:hypothetical protein
MKVFRAFSVRIEDPDQTQAVIDRVTDRFPGDRRVRVR